MTPQGESMAGEGTVTSDSRERDMTMARTDKKALHTTDGKRGEKAIGSPQIPTMHKSGQ